MRSYFIMWLVILGGSIISSTSVAEKLFSTPEEQLNKSKNPLLRESAAQVLGLRGSQSTVPLLVQSLTKDENKWVRARSAEALGLIGAMAAIAPLQNALTHEKDQRVRRSVAEALVRMGQRSGIDELMWQLKAGNNYAKAEVMEFLVATTGQPFGQDIDRWWDYLHHSGRVGLALRPIGSPAIRELRGISRGDKSPVFGPYLQVKKIFPWQQLPAIVLKIEVPSGPIKRTDIEQYIKNNGPIADGCFLLIHTKWQESLSAKNHLSPSPSSSAKQQVPLSRPGDSAISSLGKVAEPFLEANAVQFFLEQAPHLSGIGIDAPLPSSPVTSQAGPKLLWEKGLMFIEALGEIDRLQPHGTRLLLIPGEKKGPNSAYIVHVLALLP